MFGLTFQLPVKPPVLADAEKAAESLSARQTNLQREQAMLERALSPFTDPDDMVTEKIRNNRARMKEVRAELATVYREASNAQRAVADHRPAYAKALTQALAAKRRGAAEQILISLAQIESATAVLSETFTQIDRCGGRVVAMPNVLAVQEVRESAKQIIKET